MYATGVRKLFPPVQLGPATLPQYEVTAHLTRSRSVRYHQFLYDPAWAKFTPYGTDAAFGTKIFDQCHTAARARNYAFSDIL
jgi:hypothetical protein